MLATIESRLLLVAILPWWCWCKTACNNECSLQVGRCHTLHRSAQVSLCSPLNWLQDAEEYRVLFLSSREKPKRGKVHISIQVLLVRQCNWYNCLGRPIVQFLVIYAGRNCWSCRSRRPNWRSTGHSKGFAARLTGEPVLVLSVLRYVGGTPLHSTVVQWCKVFIRPCTVYGLLICLLFTRCSYTIGERF